MNEREAIDAALAKLNRNDDDSVDEKRLIDLVADLIDFDEESERVKKASRAVKSRRTPGSSTPEGQLSIPGLGSYAYEPDRLIADNEGRVIEQRRAKVTYKQCEASRARDRARQHQVWADRKAVESELFAAWVIRGMESGRDPRALTFDTFVRESELWAEGDADVEPGPGDES